MERFLKNIHTEHILTAFIIIGFLVFSRMFWNGFVGDDLGYLAHPFIQQTKLIELFQSGSADLGGDSPITGQFFRPLMLVAIALLYSIFSDQAFFYHLFQLAFHIGNVILLFFLFRKFLSKYISALLSFIYLVHPINVETVAYISDLQDVFFVFFGLFAIVILLYQSSQKTITWYVPFLLLLSLFSKETGILFGGVIFFYLYLFQKHYLKLFMISTIGIIIIYSVVRFFIAGVGLGNTHNAVLGHLTFLERILHIPGIFLYYLQTTVFPKDLAIAQTWSIKPTLTNVGFPFTIIGILFFSLITFYSYLKIKFKKESIVFLFFFIWFSLGILLHLQILPLEMTVADRWFYFPFIGLLGICGIVLSHTNIKHTSYVVFGSIVIITILSFRTFLRLGDWTDALTLYNHDNKVTKSYLLEHSLGYEYLQKNDLPMAFIHLQKAIDIYPTSQNTNSFGVYYYKTGNTVEAKKWFSSSIQLGDNFLAYNNLARVYLSERSYDNATRVLLSATQKFPQSNIFWHLLALTYYQKGDKEKALTAAEKAYGISKTEQNAYVLRQLQLGQEIKIIN